MSKRLFVSLGVALLCAALATQAAAGTIHPGNELDFLSAKNHAGGLVTYTPQAGASLSVLNAPVDFVQQFPTFFSFQVVGGYLDLVTGPCVAGCKYNTKTQTTNSFFDDGGLIQIFGSVPGLKEDPHGLLFEGVFNHNDGSKVFGHKTCQLTSVSLNGKTGKGGVGGCIEVDYVNPFLLADLGFKGGRGKGFLSTMELQLMFLHGHWTGEIGSSDMIILPNPTPEPVSLLLFTAGMASGLANTLRKRKGMI